MHGAGLKSTPNNIDDSRDEQRGLTSIRINVPTSEQSPEDGASREQAKDCADHVVGVGVQRCLGRVEGKTHGAVEAGLTHGRGDDAEVIAVGETREA